MVNLDVFTLLINGLTLSLALGFLLIIIWQNPQKRQNQAFAVFIIFIVVWNLGSILLRSTELTDIGIDFYNIALSIMEIGFIGASVSVYVMTTVLIGNQSRRFQYLAYISLIFVALPRFFLIVNGNIDNENVGISTEVSGNFQPLFFLFFLMFDGISLYLIWRYRRKVRSRGLVTGIVIFLAGQGLIFVNPELVVSAFSTNVSAMGALIIGFSMIHQEIITPLADRNNQVEAIHNVSVAITSQLALDTVLSEIAIQAGGWLNADGVGIFLAQVDKDIDGDTNLVLETVFNLPKTYVGMSFRVGEGLAGFVAQTRETLYLENYARDWKHSDDFPYAKETFGSVVCTPLIYAEQIIGVVMVIASQEGYVFNRQDAYLLELLGAQAAVVIAHSRLFDQVDEARSQLEAVLTSTENPVVSVDRQLRLLFANPAAQNLFGYIDVRSSVVDTFPKSVFPTDMKFVLRSLKRDKSFVYEIVLRDRVYLCHLGVLGEDRIEGWVAVLNDVTQLKELDRLKSEMVRMASHDLKNPLMGAMAYLELLEEDIAVIGQHELNKSVKTIEHQLERMERIIRGILDLEKLKVAFDLEDLCSPIEIVESALRDLDQFIEDRGVTVTVEIAPDVESFRGNRDQFERAIINVIENAVKFTLYQGVVNINVYNEQQRIIFRITDNGVGIPKDVVPHVFDRFFRGQQSGVEHVTGSGLGLSLVKTTVEIHSGEIWLESEINHGTTVFVSVPKKDAPGS